MKELVSRVKELVFLLEEKSAEAMLKSFLPTILNPHIKHRLIAFEGKQDLEKQIKRRLRAYQNPDARFIVLRDQDNHPDCTAIKAKLLQECHAAGKEAVCLVRIACKELETFYLADLAAVEKGLGLSNLVKHQNKKKFRAPDHLGSPSKELKTLLQVQHQHYQKVSGSRAIGQYLDPNNKRSPSFVNLISAVHRFQNELLVL